MAITVFWLFFLVQIIQNFPYLVASAMAQSHIERRLNDNSGNSGFINIDCGLAAGEYPLNDMIYTSDKKYVRSGHNFAISQSSTKSDSNDIYTTLRSFPEGRRNCYNLWPLKRNNTYLIRAQFLYGNYDGKNIIPGFDVYIGVNLWFTLTLTGVDQRLFREVIHLATAESIDVCLVNIGQGTPFMSVLELSPVDSSLYPVSPTSSLYLQHREDVGSFTETVACYYMKDDAYNRLWCMTSKCPTGWETISTNKSIDTPQGNPLKVPISMMSTACEANDMTETSSMYNQATEFYAYWYFAELELLGSNDTREFNIFVPGYKLGPITPKYLQLTTIASPRISTNGSEDLTFTLVKTNNSNRYPILNAFEVYQVLELPVLPTNQEDADAINAIKNEYEVLTKIWQGDPCLPVDYQWDGLNCTYNNNNPPRITSLSLSSSNFTGDIPPSLFKLTSLKYLNLSNNGFTGKIPDFLVHMPLLTVIDLSGNDLTGPVPYELVEKARNKSIELRLERNLDVCKSYPCEFKKKKHHFIIPAVIGFALVSLLVIIGIIYLACKQRKKQEGLVDRAIQTRNQLFTSSDIVRMTNSYRIVLGKGGFGTVYYGVLQDGTQVAVKVLDNASSTISMKQFCAEAELLTRVHHVNLVSLIGYCDEHTNMSLVYEFMSCGNLQMHLSERNQHPLSWKARLLIAIDAAQGLEYLHCGCTPPIIHRDIKPANILLDAMGNAKIADFGLSRFFATNNEGDVLSTDLAGTRGYLDPEYSRLISEKSDVYAFGIVLLQLLTGRPALLKRNNHEDQQPIHLDQWVSPMVETGDIMAIVDNRLQGDLNVNCAWKFLEIAMECVKPVSTQRPRISEVLADLKSCYDSDEFSEQNALDSVNSENYSMISSQALEYRSLVSASPSVR